MKTRIYNRFGPVCLRCPVAPALQSVLRLARFAVVLIGGHRFMIASRFALSFLSGMILRNPASKAIFSDLKMAKVSLGSGDRLYAGLNCLQPGQEHAGHVHADQDKLYVVLEGAGEVDVAGETSAVATGDIALAAAGVPHALRNPGPGRLIVLVVFSPPPGGPKA